MYLGLCWAAMTSAHAACPYGPDCLNNPYGGGKPYKPDGLMNPNSANGSQYRNNSWINRNPTDAPNLYDSQGNYPGASTSLRAQRASVGEPVAVAGYPLRGLLSGFNMTTGSLSSLSGMGGDTRLVQITAPVQPGNSGGPVLDSAGNLMGVVVSKLDAIKAAKLTGDIPQNVNFAINANVLRSFLDANSVEYETANSDKALLSTVIAEKAKGFTVLVECWK